VPNSIPKLLQYLSISSTLPVWLIICTPATDVLQLEHGSIDARTNFQSEKKRKHLLESILPTFYECNWANFLAPIKSLTFTASTKKLRPKPLHKKVAHKMLVKLTPTASFLARLPSRENLLN
jgi:hypothetical protein